MPSLTSNPENEHHHSTAITAMSTHIPIVQSGTVAQDAKEYLEQHVSEFDSIEQIFVVSTGKKLVGFFYPKKLSSIKPQDKIDSIIESITSVSSEENIHTAVYLSLKHKFPNIPVVDKKGVLLGAITAEKILSALHHKHLEESFSHAGIHKAHAKFDNIFEIPLLESIKHRLLWLLIGLMGGLVAASIISRFEQTLEQNLILAAFIPLVVYMADAVGTQLEAFAIRDFALYNKIDFGRYFARQFYIVCLIAGLLGIFTYLLSLAIYQNATISLVIGVSIWAAAISSILTGVLIPFLSRKMNIDPANVSGPIGTILQDSLSVIIYFSIASALL